MKNPLNHKALVFGRMGIIRSLGREGINVTTAHESTFSVERYSRYCRENILLPNLDSSPDQAVSILEEYGLRQDYKPVAFFNAESDVLFFSMNRDMLSKYYETVLSTEDIIHNLVDKEKFSKFAEKYDLPVPKTAIPKSKEEAEVAAEKIGYPCIMKPIRQRLWHHPDIVRSLGYHKALLINNPDEIKSILDSLPSVHGNEMIQEYIPGDDKQHYDFHAYIDKHGIPRGHLVGHKIRTYPIHCGTASYTHFVEEPGITEICLSALKRIGYTGAVNINLKRHADTGKYYILEMNPRFSVWTIFDWACSVNLPYLQYLDALGYELPCLKPSGRSQRWLWFGNDFRAMTQYRKTGELTLSQWLNSFFNYKGKIEFHIFSWDDPLPILASTLMKLKQLIEKSISFLWGQLIKIFLYRPVVF